MASHTTTNTSSGFEITKNLIVVVSSDALKIKDGKELALNPVVLVMLTNKVILPFSISSYTHSFIGPLLDAN